MVHGTVHLKLRPIRFAFLVKPSDKAGLLKAIEINTFLWGGMYNPIIPVFERLPKVWRGTTGRYLTSREILKGYLDAYDPDLVVPLGKCSARGLDVGNREVIRSSGLTDHIKSHNDTPGYGVGLFELLPYFVERELKYVRRQPLDLCVPDLRRQFRPFLASVTGVLSQNVQDIFCQRFATALGVSRDVCSISDYPEFLRRGRGNLLRLGALYLRHVGRSSWLGSASIFFLDAGSADDVIDFWNLRAGGWKVIPVARQASGHETVRSWATEFINRNYFPDGANPQLYHHTTVIKSRSTTKSEVNTFIDSLGLPPPDQTGNFRIGYQRWYPPIWDEFYPERGSVERFEVEADSVDRDFSGQEAQLSFRTLDPEFIQGYGGHGEPRFVNEAEPRVYGTTEVLAEVMPEGGADLARALTRSGFRNWRFSRRGMVYLSEHPNWLIGLSLPKAEDVFLRWLGSKGWAAELSPPGRIASQMVKQLGGADGISTLANEGIIELLELASKGKTINRHDFWGKIEQIAQQEKYPQDPKRVLQRLTDIQMFRLGLEVQCPVCTRRSWYSIGEADYELQCSNCPEKFSIRSYPPDDITWAYRAVQPFSLPDRAQGAYSVLLTLRFFSQLHLLDHATTPIMSFTAKKADKRIEADLGLFLKQHTFGPAPTELVFAECKTYGGLDHEDKKRMLLLAEEFPGAVLVFASLKKSLTGKEKGLLRTVVRRGQRNSRPKRPHSPVLILTGVELFADEPPPECWRDLGPEYAPYVTREWRYRARSGLLPLCEATQKIYLDADR